METQSIKRGVTLYSFQEEYFLGKVGLEDCIRFATSIGANGIETVEGQMMPGFPNLSAEFYANWERWQEEYGFVPVAHDAIPYLKLYKGRDRPTDELVSELKVDIDFAERLGAHIVRIHAATPNEVVSAAAPHAAEKGIKLLREMHAPYRFDSEWFESHMAVAATFGPDTVGLMPDLGIYVKRLPRVMVDRALRDGADPDYIARVTAKYEDDQDLKALVDEADNGGMPPANLQFSYQASRMIYEEPRLMLEHMPYIGHVHAKFFDMVDETTEYSIPYDVIIGVLAEGGYHGYLSSEYEGNRHVQDEFPVDSFEQVRRHQMMMARLLGESVGDKAEESTRV